MPVCGYDRMIHLLERVEESNYRHNVQHSTIEGQQVSWYNRCCYDEATMLHMFHVATCMRMRWMMA